MQKFICLCVLSFSLATVTRPAYAYLDPGTGSIILQGLLGGIAGALVVGRLYWQKIKAILGIKSPPAAVPRPEDSEGDTK